MTSYPVRVWARLDAPLSRWLWLVKWLLAIPHYVVLFFLWIAYLVLTVIVFFAILITGRYPRTIFDFNVGVLRWSWRVSYYSYGGLATDRYPPFTLDDVPDYPATLHVDYPAQLSRGLVLIKWWLLAIPHYMIIAFFTGGYATNQRVDTTFGPPGGLIALIVLFAGVALLFIGRYPRGIYDFAVGMNRWALRVAAYASLMTDKYPPFRLDLGGGEPTEPPTAPLTIPAEEAASPAADIPETGTETGTEPGAETDAGAGTAAPRPSADAATSTRWTAGRAVLVVISALLLLAGLAATAGGAIAAWADNSQRDSANFVNTPTERYATTGYAMRFDSLYVAPWSAGSYGTGWLGTVRARATSRQGEPLFVGIASSRDVDSYLGAGSGGTNYRADYRGEYADGNYHGPVVSAKPPTPPTSKTFWVASTSGSGQQSLTWEPTEGTWTVVIMNADASSGVDADLTGGATIPRLGSIGTGLLIGGGAALVVGAVLMVLAVAPRRRAESP